MGKGKKDKRGGGGGILSPFRTRSQKQANERQVPTPAPPRATNPTASPTGGDSVPPGSPSCLPSPMDDNVLEDPNVLNESVSDVPSVATNPVTTDTINTDPEDVALVVSNQTDEHLSAPQGDTDGQLITAHTGVSISQGDDEARGGINQDNALTQETDSGIFSRDVDAGSRLRIMSHDDVL